MVVIRSKILYSCEIKKNTTPPRCSLSAKQDYINTESGQRRNLLLISVWLILQTINYRKSCSRYGHLSVLPFHLSQYAFPPRSRLIANSNRLDKQDLGGMFYQGMCDKSYCWHLSNSSKRISCFPPKSSFDNYLTLFFPDFVIALFLS